MEILNGWECLKGPRAGKAEYEGCNFQIDYFFAYLPRGWWDSEGGACGLSSGLVLIWSLGSSKKFFERVIFLGGPRKRYMFSYDLDLDGSCHRFCHTLLPTIFMVLSRSKGGGHRIPLSREICQKLLCHFKKLPQS